MSLLLRLNYALLADARTGIAAGVCLEAGAYAGKGGSQPVTSSDLSSKSGLLSLGDEEFILPEPAPRVKDISEHISRETATCPD